MLKGPQRGVGAVFDVTLIRDEMSLLSRLVTLR